MGIFKTTLIVDLDNTLFDWVGLWYATFTALLSEVTHQTGLTLESLESEIREIHQKHRTSEYAFLLSDLAALAPYRGGRSATEVFASAISAFRRVRRDHLRLYPTVAETLLKIKGSGCQVVAYTESLRFYSFYRVKRLGLDGVIDVLYSPEDHAIPEDVPRHYTEDFYAFRFTQHRFTPAGELKPNATILRSILSECEAEVDSAVYVGDSRHKDIAMADDVGVDSAWARYGEAQGSEAYTLLKRVTHWTDEDMKREDEIRARKVLPKIVLDDSFAQVLEHFEFGERHRTKVCSNGITT